MSAQTTITPEALAQLGRAGQPWEFLGIASALGSSALADDGLRFLIAINLGRLGLRTPALEQLAAMEKTTASHPDVVSLARVIGELPDDRVAAKSRERTARLNLDALVARGAVASREATRWIEQWQESAGEVCRAVDGNVVRRAGRGGSLSDWAWLEDAQGTARSVAAGLPAAREVPPPMVIVSIAPPWLVRELCEKTPDGAGGAAGGPEFGQRVILVHEDPVTLVEGLGLADVRMYIIQPRTRWFLGPGAGRAMAQSLDDRFQLPRRCQCAVKTDLEQLREVGRVIEAAHESQGERARRAEARLAAAYAGRDAVWWARRYKEAMAGGEPLRVLLPTTRYSTFVKHSAADIAAAFRSCGHHAELLIEPDETSKLTANAYLDAFERLRPDLIVSINYPRAVLKAPIPENVPFVCWVQDAMPHLFGDGNATARNDPFEYVVGHCYPGLFREGGFALRRALPLPVPVSHAKFHDGPVRSSLRERFACEVAFVTHHSQEPEEYRDELLAQAPDGSWLRGLIPEAYALVVDLMKSPLEQDFEVELRAPLRAALARHGWGGDEARFTLLVNQVCRPLADRMIRHESIRWAVEIGRRRGWRVHLYGRGWEGRPGFEGLAKGPLAHGEELRAAYQCAAITVHASISHNLHQRVLECALSGGLPICRLKCEDVTALVGDAAVRLGHRLGGRAYAKPVLAAIADDADLMAAVAQCQRLEASGHALRVLESGDLSVMRLSEKHLINAWSHNAGHPVLKDVAGLLGDLSQTGFWSQESLEAAVEKAVERPLWREDLGRGIAGRVRRNLTYEAAAAGIVGLVRGTLEEEDRKEERGPA